MKSITERFAQEIIQSFKMAWEGQRLFDEAYREANKYDGTNGDHAPWQYRMDAAERKQKAADEMTNDVEARAIAAGVDVTDMLFLVDQHLNGTALAA
jgi:hypothetical protein